MTVFGRFTASSQASKPEKPPASGVTTFLSSRDEVQCKKQYFQANRVSLLSVILTGEQISQVCQNMLECIFSFSLTVDGIKPRQHGFVSCWTVQLGALHAGALGKGIFVAFVFWNLDVIEEHALIF